MTGGYRKPSDSIPTGSVQWDSTWPSSASNAERERLLGYLEERFGIPEFFFRHYLFFKRSKGWRILRASPHLEGGAFGLRVSVVGIPAFHKIGPYIKPSTRFIQVFGSHATRARLELTSDELESPLSGEEIPSTLSVEDGYVILFHRGSPLGLGLLLNGKVRSQLPKDICLRLDTQPSVHVFLGSSD